ncbi:helix-turn-helix domain-containing protein [Legionella pneumophila serogroup 1]|uniref:helix-turn-helix domain-containing protein n=1 Tax=Legionella pneumophila TaxID=446 RepID=UPI001A19F0F6|nr:helix-turn-helix domain-containing protein [Legionella pneumophila]HAT9741620.1 helix-turn-helix domain-containing protein [Legionella pneumophila subsp. pneumophila]MCH9059785.1 helix-turn-helix domain-containing protein [Legionella pneumophila serogroup 1]MCH9071793.1 helix-turn-helix domain-containing protein [Legionella pneumophila serogroup 1]MCH9077823.1 helix-turn-helix domain-containing protein [Legionella pneumophila serogroup 1]MCH9080747.1 helix-turn-helix domain-containing prote
MSTNILSEPNNLQLAQTLTDLIERENKLTPAALARKLGIPTNKITRILNGDVTDPKASTLLQIANYFGITIEQLLGIEPIVREGVSNHEQTIQSLPIYEFSNPTQKAKEWYRWSSNEIDGEYYALAIDTDLYEPTFPKNSLLIVNPHIMPDDRSYIVVKRKDNQQHCSIKKYVIEGSQSYLYPINPKLPVELFDKNLYTIAGVILEVHQKLRSKK